MLFKFKTRMHTTMVISFIAFIFLISNCSNNNTVETSYIPGAPTNFIGRALSSSSIQLYWADNSTNETSFIIYRAEVSIWEQIATTPANQTSYTDSLLQDSASYKYYLIAKNLAGNSAPSDTIIIMTHSIGSPPTDISNPIPINGAENQPITQILSWHCADSDNDTLRFELYLGLTPDPLLIDSMVLGTMFNPGILNYGSMYYWRVIAKDGHYHRVVGDLWNFSTIINYPPNEPQNPYPPDGASRISLNPELRWVCIDPENDTLRYDVYFGSSSNPPLLYSNLDLPYYLTGPLEQNSFYYWKITARDGYGNETIGAEWNFATVTNDPPNAPQNPMPFDGQVDIPLRSALQWECFDPDGDSLSYDVYFGTEQIPSLIISNLRENVFDPGQLLANTNYYWNIVAKDIARHEVQSSTWFFTTRDTTIYRLSIILEPPDGGSVQLIPDQEYFFAGDSVVLSAQPSSGYAFVNWLERGNTYIDTPYLIVFGRSDIEVHANFTTSPTIRGNITWPDHSLSSHTYAFADSEIQGSMFLVSQASVNSITGNYVLIIENLTMPKLFSFESQDDVNNSGPWAGIDSGDGWGFYDSNGDGIWNDIINVAPGAHLIGVNIILRQF